MSNKFFIELNSVKHEFPELTLVDLVGYQLDHVLLKNSDRLEGRLKRLLSEVVCASKKLTNAKGPSQREKFKQKVREVALMKNEVENVRELDERLESCKRELIETRKACIDTYEKLLQAKSTVRSQTLEIGKLRNENSELNSYLKIKYGADGTPTDASDDILKNTGGTYDSVKAQQKRRKLVGLKKNVSQVLWFAHTYGLTPSVLSLKSTAGEDVKITLDGTGDSVVPKAPKSFNELCDGDKEKIQQLAYVLDRFGVSNVCYHELHMICEGVPDSKLLVQAQDDLSEIFEIHRAPGGSPGAYISFKKEVLRLCKLDKIEDVPTSTKAAFGGMGLK